MAAQQPPLALPPPLSPDDLDSLSELSLVLARVRTGIQSSSGLATTPGGPSPGQQPGPHPLPHPQHPPLRLQQPLSLKDVPGATDGLKHKLQHARAQVRALPDMDRSMDEQRREMRDLEARIGLQRALLERLRSDGVHFAKDDGSGDVKMDT